MKLESEWRFKFEPDLAVLREQLGLDEDQELSDDDIEDAKLEAFDEWKKEYFDSLSEEDQLDFAMSYYYVDGYCDDDPNAYEYEMEIPEEIALLAEAEE